VSESRRTLPGHHFQCVKGELEWGVFNPSQPLLLFETNLVRKFLHGK